MMAVRRHTVIEHLAALVEIVRDERGKMLYTRVTPDGYQLDINGVWVAPLAKAQ